MWVGFSGWSGLAATNAPVADEPVEAVFRMNDNPILLARIFFFSHLFSTPKFSPVLPTTYQPLPPHSIARAPDSRNVERERAWSLEPAWSGNELGAWNELGAAGAGPTQDLGKHFFKITMFIFFTQVSVLLQRKLRSLLQRYSKLQAP